MVQLPAELKLKILSLLSGDFKSLKSLEEVFPHEMLFKHALYSEQAIFIGGHELHYYRFESCTLPPENIHRFDDVLKEGNFFKLAVTKLNIYLYTKPLGDEAAFKILAAILIKEPCLQAVRVLKLHGYCKKIGYYDEKCPEMSKYMQKKNYDDASSYRAALNKVALKKVALKNVASKSFASRSAVTQKVDSKKKIRFIMTMSQSPIQWDVPEPIDYEKVKITCSSIESSFSEVLSNLQHLKELQYQYCSPIQIEKTRIRHKLLKLECLKADLFDFLIEDNFDEYLPNLKFLDLSHGEAISIPKFSHTSLEELHFRKLKGSNFESLFNLSNLKKLVVKGCELDIDGIIHLKALEQLKIKKSYDGMEPDAVLELDHNLPTNLKELWINGFATVDIINLPLSLQKMEIVNCEAVNNNGNLSYTTKQTGRNGDYLIQDFKFGGESPPREA